MLHELQAENLLTALCSEIGKYTSGKMPTEFSAGRAILAADPQVQIAVVRMIVSDPRRHMYLSSDVLSYLCKRKLPYTLDDLRILIHSMEISWVYARQALLRSLTGSLTNPETLAACRTDLEKLRATANTWYDGADRRKFLKLLDSILNGQKEEQSLSIAPDSWGTLIAPTFDDLEVNVRDNWTALLRHCVAATSSTPTNKWLTQMQPLVERLGQEQLSKLATVLFSAMSKSKGSKMDETNGQMLRGLAWCCINIESRALSSALGDAALEGYRKIPGFGPRIAKVATACVSTLKTMPGLYGLAQLERLRLGVKQPTYIQGIEQALDEASTRIGMSRDELEELTIPTFGLIQGCLHTPIGSATTEIQVTGAKAHLQWFDAAGKPRKNEPAETKRMYKTELKDLQRLLNDISQMLNAQRDRLERLPLAKRQWSLSVWRERYLHHPLIGSMVQRLLWRFTDGKKTFDGIWYENQLVDVYNQPLHLPDTTLVTAWHPVMSNAAEVLAWRTWLEHHQITQPFKQAHREVYILTDAERTTNTYSNRFAAHILRQHQFNALATARTWQNKLRMMVDDSYPPATILLPKWDLRAEFWIEGLGDEYGVATNEAGTYLYVGTDQVRFYPLNASKNYAQAGSGHYFGEYDYQKREFIANKPVPLEDIPPLVFSEVLRDVDLFVGVTSIGNDPMWQDGGSNGHYRDYWHMYSFGELSAAAETRKQLLARLIPKLALAARCTIEGRFLLVQGDLRTYKIHLGSGNILMTPNDQYLCIVPGRGKNANTTETPFLPFEGDTILSIILSKAFLLAEDTKITDPSIKNQIDRR